MTPGRASAKTVVAWGALLGVAAILLTLAVRLPIAQDWIPFHIAARMAPAGEWESLYAVGGASLFDVSPRYRQVAIDSLGAEGSRVLGGGKLSAFVAPPPAAFLLAFAKSMSWRNSQRLWGLSLALPLIFALGTLAVTISQQGADALFRFAAICVLSFPLLGYVVATGQPSAWLAVAACFSVVPRSRLADVAGGVSLALGILTKMTPVVLVLGLWVSGRRRMAVIAGGLTLSVAFGSLPWTGLEAWTRFAQLVAHLGSTVITDWNNASVDALIARAGFGVADSTFRNPDALMWYSALAVRGLILGLAGYVALRRKSPQVFRITAVWIGWLAISPLLWLHYLAVLVPLLSFISGRGLSLLLAGALSAPPIARISGVDDLSTGFSLGLVWLCAAASLLAVRSQVEPQERGPA